MGERTPERQPEILHPPARSGSGRGGRGRIPRLAGRLPHCGFERSVWETGGVRYRASGSSRVRMACPRCGRTGWQKILKGPDFPAVRGPVWPLVRLVVGLVLAILLVVAAIVL